MRDVGLAGRQGKAAAIHGAPHAAAWPIRWHPRPRPQQPPRAVVISRAEARAPGSPDAVPRNPYAERREVLPLPSGPDSGLQALRSVTGMTEAEAELASLFCPEVVALRRATISDHWAQLCALLPVDRRMLTATCTTHPMLLVEPVGFVQARVSQAAPVLGLEQPPEQLVQRCSPPLLLQLVLQDPDLIAHKLGVLASLLRVAAEDARRLVLAWPPLLSRSDAHLQAAMRALQQVYGLQAAELAPCVQQAPVLLAMQPADIKAAAAGLRRVLQLSPVGLAEVLQQAPGVLSVTPERIELATRVVAGNMGVSAEEALNLLLQEPQLLQRSGGSLAGCLEALVAAFQLDQDALLQVVEFDPTVLLDSPGALLQRCATFRRLATSNEAWARQWRALMSQPANVARSLNLQQQHFDRLAYLAASGRAPRASLVKVLTMGRSEFRRRYPKFEEWLDAQRLGGKRGRAARYRLARVGGDDGDDGDGAFRCSGSEEEGEEDEGRP